MPVLIPPPGEPVQIPAQPGVQSSVQSNFRLSVMESWLNPKNLLGLLASLGVILVGINQYLGKTLDPETTAFVKSLQEQAKAAKVPVADQKAVSDLAEQMRALTEALKQNAAAKQSKTSFEQELSVDIREDESPSYDMDSAVDLQADVDKLKSDVAVIGVNLNRAISDIDALKARATTQATAAQPTACGPTAMGAGRQPLLPRLRSRLRGAGCN